VAASAEMPLSASSDVVKMADIPLPDDRPHTISSAVYQPPVHPPIIPDTFGPPTVTTAVASGLTKIYSRPSLMSKDSRGNVPTAVATPTIPVAANPVISKG